MQESPIFARTRTNLTCLIRAVINQNFAWTCATINQTIAETCQVLRGDCSVPS